MTLQIPNHPIKADEHEATTSSTHEHHSKQHSNFKHHNNITATSQ
jgi:hypothetical protein